MKELRSIVVKVVIASFGIAASLGIVALLTGGSFSDTEGRILLTTVIVGATSIAILCYLATADTPFRLVGLAGAVSALLSLTLALMLTWSGGNGDDDVWTVFGIGVTISASLAQACLLLALAHDSRAVVRRMLYATLGFIAIVAALIIIPIIDGSDLDDTYWRLFGVVAILDVLGTIVVAALQKFIPAHREVAEERRFSAALDARITAAAQSRGISEAQLISEALDSLGGPEE